MKKADVIAKCANGILQITKNQVFLFRDIAGMANCPALWGRFLHEEVVAGRLPGVIYIGKHPDANIDTYMRV